MHTDGELWHVVEAKRDDGVPTTFRIRELAPDKRKDRIFVVEMPYPTTEMSRLPSAMAYRRLAQFEEQWLLPAGGALGWDLVGVKSEDGSFFLYLYGASDPEALVRRLAPYDAALGFYDDRDPDWTEYATLRELLEQAKAMPRVELEAEERAAPSEELAARVATAKNARVKRPRKKRGKPTKRAKPKKPVKRKRR